MSKKQLIMETALELFAKQGFEATSVQQITEKCGISKGAFYLSFKSKDELIIALVDYFMEQITADIDHIVRNTKEEELLYQYYYTIYHWFERHSDFAKVVMKEPTQPLNKEFIQKMHFYDKLIDNLILWMIERLYGEAVNQTKYDLMYCIKGFMNMYFHLFVLYNIPIDLRQLAESLVEKTNLLAKHMTLPFVSPELFEVVRLPLTEEVSKEKLLEVIGQKIDDVEESLVKDSLILPKEHLIAPAYPPAIIKGLIENIRRHPHCKWIAYLLERNGG